MNNTRELVLDMLMEITASKAYSHILIRDVLTKYNYSDPRDKAFIKRVTEGTLERMIQIDYVINLYSKVSVSKMKPLICALMRMSVYQLLFMDNVPDSAVCNEAVKLAGKRGFRNLQGFVNGVLRNIARNKENIVYPVKEKNPKEYLSVRYSMPVWLVEKWCEEYGEAKTEKMLEGMLTIHKISVRISSSCTKQEEEAWLAKLQEHGVQVMQHPYLSYDYELENVDGVANLPGFAEGFFTVQDVSSMLVAEAAGIKEQDTILDVCAAPGGKATHAADKLHKTGLVIARDLTETKVSYIQENVKRLQLENMQVQVWDACVLDEQMIEKADILFTDVPCSGLGIIGKKRDIKYRVSPESLTEVTKLQKEIMKTVWQYVKKGGILMYSTCTINRMENQEMVDWICRELPFERVSMKEMLPEELQADEKDGMLQVLPGIHASDGFFVAKLRRK